MEDTKSLTAKTGVSPLAKLALEVGPLAVFFIGNRVSDIIHATGAFMIATLVSLAVSRIMLKRVPVLALVTGVFVLVFGFLTVYLHDELFIKIKPTVVNVLFASILTAGLYFRRPVLKFALGEVMQLSEQGWRVLTLRWIAFFLFLAVSNEAVRQNFSTDTWAGFKFFGVPSLTLLFMMSQIPLILKHQTTPKPE